MSADNGVYVMEFFDQFRVETCQSIDNLWWHPPFSHREGNSCQTMNPVELWKYFNDAAVFVGEFDAVRYAWRILRNLPVCEYGVQCLSYGGTWKNCCEDAKKYIKEILEQKDEMLRRYNEQSPRNHFLPSLIDEYKGYLKEIELS